MDKEKIDKYREDMSKRNGIVGVIVMSCLVVGLGVLFYGLWTQTTWAQVVDNEHMTDDGIAYRDLENATYTWSASDIQDKIATMTVIVYTGGILMAVGYAGMLIFAALTPDKKKDHLRYCTDLAPYKTTGWENIEVKYCPECGLKLSRLEKD